MVVLTHGVLLQTYEEMVGADGALHTQRDQFIKFWKLVKRAHPVQECRAGTRSMLANLDVWWPLDADSRVILPFRQ